MTRLLCLAALAAAANAFSNTAPLLVWSSERSGAIDALPKSAVQASTVIDSLLTSDEICDYDAVVLVQQRGLHASDLRNLSPSSSDLPSFLKHSPSSKSFQYLVNDGSSSLSDQGREVATQCGARFLQQPGDDVEPLDTSEKNVINIILPDLTETGQDRRSAYSEQERDLSDALDSITTSFPKSLVIYAGIPVVPVNARASPAVQFPHFADDLPEGGILKRYQLLTPGLITVLLVVFFVLLPVLLMGIKALAAIQNPIKMDIPKGYNAQEKKSQ